MRAAAMFDIDDTLITNSGSPIAYSINLLKKLKRQGYVIVIMTARPPEFKEYTVRQLKKFGIPYDTLVFSPARDKTRAKNQLKNYKFVLSVGDKTTDLGGSTYWIKMPDYRVPTIKTNISSDFRNFYKL